MKIDRIIFASHNSHKTNEIKKMVPFEICDLTDLEYPKEIIETGDTLEENAMIKAKAVYDYFKEPCFAEDTGLEVYALDMLPGVYTARYAGQQRSPEENMKKLLSALQHHTDRRARFRTALCYIDNEKVHVFEGIVEGSIGYIPQGDKGFGYDPIFIPEHYQQSFAELEGDIKNKISHRKKAVEQFVQFLKEI